MGVQASIVALVQTWFSAQQGR